MEFEVVFWYWWVAAVLLLGIEMLSPGFFFLWMAVSALVTGLFLLIVPVMSIEIQFLTFAVLSMSSVLAWKRYMSDHPTESDHPTLNQRGAEYVGQIFPLLEAIEHGRGKVKAGGVRWNVEGEDCPLGSAVKVTEVTGTVFKVKKVD